MLQWVEEQNWAEGQMDSTDGPDANAAWEVGWPDQTAKLQAWMQTKQGRSPHCEHKHEPRHGGTRENQRDLGCHVPEAVTPGSWQCHQLQQREITLILTVLCNSAPLCLQPGPPSTLCREEIVLVSWSLAALPTFSTRPTCWASPLSGMETGGSSWVQLSRSLSPISSTPSSSAGQECAMHCHLPPAPTPRLVPPVWWWVCSSHKQKSTPAASLHPWVPKCWLQCCKEIFYFSANAGPIKTSMQQADPLTMGETSPWHGQRKVLSLSAGEGVGRWGKSFPVAAVLHSPVAPQCTAFALK